ncbi:MAG: amino acid adenylation domain-containing protein, partial [Acidobacteriota bacterium]
MQSSLGSQERRESLGERRAQLSEAKLRLLEKWRSGRAGKSKAQAIPRHTGGPAPLSYSQQRFWFLHQLQPSSSAYNVPRAYRLSGPLQAPVLADCLDDLAGRHAILRTTFPALSGTPVQQVGPFTSRPLPQVDLENLADQVRESEASRLVEEISGRPFAPVREPVWRTVLLRMAAQDHGLVVVMHHLICDGWSLGVFMQELSALYPARRAGAAPSLPPLPIQFGDYAAWQRQRLQGAQMQSDLDYWVDQLKGAPQLLPLPLDRPRPALQTWHGSEQAFSMPIRLFRKLQAFGRENGNATPFMVLQAGLAALLHRLTHQKDLLTGTPVANRSRKELEGLIGPFINTLVLRSRIRQGISFRQLVVQVRDCVLGAFAHQEFPFGLLVEELDPERDTRYTPLFQLLFVFQNAGRGERTDLDGVSVGAMRYRLRTSMFDLSLFMGEGKDGRLLGRAEYNSDLFDASTITRWTGQLRCLLRSALADPDAPLQSLPWTGDAERHQLLVEWNDTAALPPTGRDALLDGLFEAQTQRAPDRTALVWQEHHLSYSDLGRRADQLADWLSASGLEPEARVGILMQRRPEMALAMLAVLKAGGAYVPLDLAQPDSRLAYMLRNAQAAGVLTETGLGDRLKTQQRPHPCGLWNLDLVLSGTSEPEEEPAGMQALPAENLAYVIYTSGSTGRPKGIAIPHRTATQFVRWAGRAFGSQELESVLAATSICFDLSIFEFFVPWSIGGQVVLVRDALELARPGAAEGVTLINTVPSAAAGLLQQGAFPASIRTVNLAGEALPRSLVEALYATGTVKRVNNLYGPSEDTTYSTWATIADSESRRPSIGRPVSNTQAHVLDARLRPLPIGVIGELCLGGEGLARGYLGRPARTAQSFWPDPFSGRPGRRLYRTGDRVRLLASGELDFLGRFDHQIKLRGYRIELGEVEAALCRHPEVGQAVVDVRDQRLIGYLCRRNQESGIRSQEEGERNVGSWQLAVGS